MSGKATPAPAPASEEGRLAGGVNAQVSYGISEDEMRNLAVMGYRMYEHGKYSDARTIFQGLVALNPKEPYYAMALGATCLAEEDLKNARYFFDLAIYLNPNEVAPYVNRGEVNFQEGRVLEAAQDFATAVKLDPQRRDPLTQRARVLAATAASMLEHMGLSPAPAKKEARKP